MTHTLSQNLKNYYNNETCSHKMREVATFNFRVLTRFMLFRHFSFKLYIISGLPPYLGSKTDDFWNVQWAISPSVPWWLIPHFLRTCNMQPWQYWQRTSYTHIWKFALFNKEERKELLQELCELMRCWRKLMFLDYLSWNTQNMNKLLLFLRNVLQIQCNLCKVVFTI